MLKIEEDGTTINPEGKILFFSIKRFIEDICFGDKCFICGKSSIEKQFNNEHVLPKWILKKFNLFNRDIWLPNNSNFRYDKYVIPCCQDCNDLMNRTFEQPLKKLFENGFDNFITYLNENGPWLIFIWLNIMFMKTYLKDKSLKLHLKKPDTPRISDLYTWEDLHHVHCIARSFFTHANLDPKILGSFMVFNAKELSYVENFDYADIYEARSIILRVNDIAIIAVLNDTGISQEFISHILEKIDGKVSSLQLREIFARLSFASQHLKSRPEFYSEIDPLKGTYKISANFPPDPQEDETLDCNMEDFGKLMYFCCYDILSKKEINELKLLRQNIERGDYTFIIGPDKKFISNSMDLQ